MTRRDDTAVEVISVRKSYGEAVAVRDVSFTLSPGEVLGLVGPNGAGKTTTIRMMLDMIYPDDGRVLIFGEPFKDEHRALIGYLPEERGLYRGLTVSRNLEYFGTLKGLTRADARTRAASILDTLRMSEYSARKMSELSRGMSQMIQVGATVLHEPRLMILDEPFSSLDPLNVRLVKELLSDMRSKDTAIVLSTHQMNQVEELCDRVLMINRGEVVLYGTLAEVRSSTGQSSIFVESRGSTDGLPRVARTRDHGTYVELVLEPDGDHRDVLVALVERGADIRRFEVAAPPLEEIFIQMVGASSE